MLTQNAALIVIIRARILMGAAGSEQTSGEKHCIYSVMIVEIIISSSYFLTSLSQGFKQRNW